MIENTCCFIGHREIKETKELISKLFETVEKLILEENVDTFLFGSKSYFNNLCLKNTWAVLLTFTRFFNIMMLKKKAISS